MITLLHSLSKRWGERNAIFMTGESLNVWILLVAPEYGRVWRHSAVLAGSARASGQLARKLSPLLLPMSAVVLRVASVAVDFESSRRSYCPPILMEIMLWLLGGQPQLWSSQLHLLLQIQTQPPKPVQLKYRSCCLCVPPFPSRTATVSRVHVTSVSSRGTKPILCYSSLKHLLGPCY